MSSQKPTIHITTVLHQLKSGFTRTKSDKMYNPNIGSIEEAYGLTPSAVKILFDHPKLKGVRTSVVVEPPFILVDEEEQADTVETTTPTEDFSNDVLEIMPQEESVTENVETELEETTTSEF